MEIAMPPFFYQDDVTVTMPALKKNRNYDMYNVRLAFSLTA